ncbi:MAG: hypothetical protein ACPGUY_03095 [Akkermansiaceae bacterium]
MSEENDPKPMKKTSAVPLRKETVRVTLKSTPEDSKAPAPPAAPKPPAPAPTIPLKTSGPATTPPAPAPTVPLKAGGAPTKPAAPAPTVQLSTPGATGPGTVPLAGGASQPLPKATVQLQQTQPMGAPASPSQAATIRTADDDDGASNEGEGAATGLAVVALVVALIVLGVQIMTANIWIEDAGGWGKLFG